jgi:hypothetical protein
LECVLELFETLRYDLKTGGFENHGVEILTLGLRVCNDRCLPPSLWAAPARLAKPGDAQQVSGEYFLAILCG